MACPLDRSGRLNAAPLYQPIIRSRPVQPAFNTSIAQSKKKFHRDWNRLKPLGIGHRFGRYIVVESIAGKAKSGIWGWTTSWPAGSLGSTCFCSRGPRHREDHHRAAVPAGGSGAGEKCLYITLSETERELRDGARLARLDARRRHRSLRTGAAGEPARSEQQQSLLYSSDLELGETTKQIFAAVERAATAPGRARQPVRNPAAGAELAALPPADPGDQALLRTIRRHRPPARRSDR